MAIDGGLRPEFRKRLPQVHWQAVETGQVGMGVPDHNGCIAGREFWVEHKVTNSHSVGLRPEQVGWILRRRRAGGRVFVATRRRHEGGPRKGPAVDELWIHDGQHAAELKAEGLLSAPPLTVQHGGPSRWDWGRVLEVMVD